jgi:hypothetical protein
VPLTLEGPARTMRGVSAPVAVTSSRLPEQSARRYRPGRGAGGRGSGIRRGPLAAGHRGCGARQPPRRRACVRRTRRSCRPAAARPRVNRGRLRRVTLAVLSRWAARVRPRCSRPGPSGPARRRCALEALRRESCHSSCGYCGYLCEYLRVPLGRHRLVVVVVTVTALSPVHRPMSHAER